MRVSRVVALVSVLLVVATLPPNASQGAPPAGADRLSSKGTLSISAVLVDHSLTARPVPMHSIQIVGTEADTVVVRTATDGRSSVTLAEGEYFISSIAPVPFEGIEYRWELPATVRAGETTELTLSNDNALSGQARGPGAFQGSAEPATILFERFSQSVFRVEAGLSHGTGFLVDTLGGVILTNAHVVEGTEAGNVSVMLDAQTRVRAQLLARDPDADVAVLRVHPRYISGRARIILQKPVWTAPVVPGERLFAMGYPLHQDLTITSGIASSVRAGAVISDVNINPGNSGGPLLNANAEAIAINTFGDVAARGPGVSGSVLVSRAGPALSRAHAELEQAQSISDAQLPIVPRERLSITTLKAYADTVDLRLYKGFSGIDLGGFSVNLQTPAQVFVALKVYENDIAKDRKKREAKAGLSEEERYSEVREYRDWAEYVGVSTTPVVALAIVPKVGETGGSVFKRMMISPYLQATYKFQGDVKGAEVFRNGELVEAIKGGHAPTKVLVEDRWVSLKDVADQGFYIFDAELLRPDSSGVAPSIVLTVQDLKSPRKLKCRELPGEVVARAWNDFEEFYREARPEMEFRPADVRASKRKRPEWVNDDLKNECSWYPY